MYIHYNTPLVTLCFSLSTHLLFHPPSCHPVILHVPSIHYKDSCGYTMMGSPFKKKKKKTHQLLHGHTTSKMVSLGRTCGMYVCWKPRGDLTFGEGARQR